MQIKIYLSPDDRTNLTRQLYKYGYSTYAARAGRTRAHIGRAKGPQPAEYARFLIDLLSDNPGSPTPTILSVSNLWHGTVDHVRSNLLQLDLPYELHRAPGLPMFKLTTWDELLTNIARENIHPQAGFNVIKTRPDEIVDEQLTNLLTAHPEAASYNIYMHLVNDVDLTLPHIFPIQSPEAYYDARPTPGTPEWEEAALTGPMKGINALKWKVGQLPRRYYYLTITNKDRDALLALAKTFSIIPSQLGTKFKEAARLGIVIEALDHGLLRRKIQAD